MPLSETQERELEVAVSRIADDMAKLDKLVRDGTAAFETLTATINPEAVAEAVQATLMESTHFVELRQQMSAGLARADASWRAVVDRRHSDIAEVLTDGTKLLGLADELLDNLEKEVSDISEYLQELDEAREILFESTRSKVEDAFDTASTSVQELEEGMRERLDTLAQHVNDLEETISEALEEADEEIGESLLAPVKELSAAIEEALDDLGEYLTAEVRDALLESVDTAFVAAAKEKIDELASRLKAELSALGEKLVDESDDTNSQREALQMALEILGPADAAVRPVLDIFKGIAASVGVAV